MEYITLKEFSEKYNIPEDKIESLCEEGKIASVVRDGITWLIPKDTDNPLNVKNKIYYYFSRNKQFYIFATVFVIAVFMVSMSIFKATNQYISNENNIQNAENNSQNSNIVSSQNEPKQENSDAIQTQIAQDSEDNDLYPYLYCNPPANVQIKDNTIFLTFDDGPSDCTDEILDILARENVKATFFVIGKKCDRFPDKLRRIVNEGHTIGIHTYTHDYNDIYYSTENFVNDFNKAFESILSITEIRPNIYRFPGGSVNEFNKSTRSEIINEMNRRGFTYYDWNVASGDGLNNVSVSQEISNVLNYLPDSGQGIVLMHDSGNKKNTVNALEEIIKGIKEQGYELDKLTNKIKNISFYKD